MKHADWQQNGNRSAIGSRASESIGSEVALDGRSCWRLLEEQCSASTKRFKGFQKPEFELSLCKGVLTISIG